MIIDDASLLSILAPFEVVLDSTQRRQVLAYLDLLLRWNRSVNLTAIRSPQECVTRHFGESLYLATKLKLTGRLLDIGSGAGFPGLALKIAFPALVVTLLEPVAKKRAFLKEVARACGMQSVEVRPERIEDFEAPAAQGGAHRPVDAVTARAVGRLPRLVPQAAAPLKPGGHLCLWVSRQQGKELQRLRSRVRWEPPLPLPLSRQREIWLGTVMDD